MGNHSSFRSPRHHRYHHLSHQQGKLSLVIYSFEGCERVGELGMFLLCVLVCVHLPTDEITIFVYHYTITLWFPCLDGLIQTRLSANQSTRYMHVIL